jgi:hypothetical protein
MEFLIESGEPDFHDVIASYAYYVSEEVRTVLFAQYLGRSLHVYNLL